MRDYIRVRGKDFAVAAFAVSGDKLVWKLVGEGLETRKCREKHRTLSLDGRTKAN